MPTYQYTCTSAECGHRFERVQAFTDVALTDCPQCAERVRKVYGSIGVVFKGSGFYRNDSRDPKSSSVPAGTDAPKSDGGKSDGGKSDGGKSDGGKSDGGKSDSGKPAADATSGSKSAPAKPDSAGSSSRSAKPAAAAAAG
jgi:putative FmdB family regulatory protein